MRFAVLTAEEKVARDNLINKIKISINKLLPDCKVHAYGSYANNLASYYSDIDIGVDISKKPEHSKLLRITELLQCEVGLSRYIDARVPIIRGRCK